MYLDGSRIDDRSVAAAIGMMRHPSSGSNEEPEEDADGRGDRDSAPGGYHHAPRSGRGHFIILENPARPSRCEGRDRDGSLKA